MQVFRLDCETYEWEKVNSISSDVPEARDSHSANLVNHKMWVFGGSNSDLLYNQFWTFDLQTTEWIHQTPFMKGEMPSAREGHSSAVLYNQFLIIIGGFNSEVN